MPRPSSEANQASAEPAGGLAPLFDPVTSKRPIDDVLRSFFNGFLCYGPPIQLDPDDIDPRRADAWRMVFPVADSRPFAVSYQRGLSSMARRDISRLYIDRVIRHRDSTPSIEPVLYGLTDGARYVFFSADPARNRDDRFDLSPTTWQFHNVRQKALALHSDHLEFQTRAGRKRPLIEFLFEANALSADDRFKRYAQTVREELLRAVLNDQRALGAVVYWLVEMPEARAASTTRYVTRELRLKLGLKTLCLETGKRLGDSVAAAVDTLLLRYIMVRFLEAYHPEAMEGLLTSGDLIRRGRGSRREVSVDPAHGTQFSLLGGTGDGTRSFSDTEIELASLFNKALGIDVSKAKKTARGSDVRQLDLFAFEDEEALTTSVLAEEEKRQARLGGDFYLADLGQAAREVEEALLADPRSRGAKLIQDFLGRTGAPEQSLWEFRYEDLRPQTLQDYYESSLGTVVQLAFDTRTNSFELEVAKSNSQRKELGAYYTDPRLCRFMVERSVKPIFEERLTALREAIAIRDTAAAKTALDSIVGMSICDPTMGSAPFLRSAFDYLSEQYLPLCHTVAEARVVLPSFFQEVSRQFMYLGDRGGSMDDDGHGRWELHVLRRMLYGVDIDLKAVCIACQTFALSAMRYLKQGERFPSFFNVNLKLGNALISPVSPEGRRQLARDHGPAIATLIRYRREAMDLPNTENAYGRFASLMQAIEVTKRVVVNTLIQERIVQFLQGFTEELRPFCWELEFPEVFFRPDGTLKAVAGFDVTIGNPPWEGLKLNDEDFFRVLDPSYPKSLAKNKIKTDLLAQSTIASTYAHFAGMIQAQRQYFVQSGHYSVQGSMGLNQLNLYKVSLEKFLQLNADAGYTSIVVPGGILCDSGCFELRQHILGSNSLEEVRQLWTNGEIFPEIHKDLPIAVIAIRRYRGPTTTIRIVADVRSLSDINSARPAHLTYSNISDLNPSVLPIPLVRSTMDAELLLRLSTGPRISDSVGPWRLKAGTELFENASTVHMRNTEGNGPIILRGAMVFPYRIDRSAGRRAYLKREYLNKFPGANKWRLIHRDANDIVLARRVFAAICPPGSVLFDSVEVLDGNLDLATLIFLCGVLNSVAMEWRFRLQSTNNHIRTLVADLTLEPPRKILRDAIVVRAGRLLLDGKCLEKKDFVSQFRDMDMLFESQAHGLSNLDPLSEPDRRQLASEIDGLVAKHLEMRPTDVDLVLGWFTKLTEEVKGNIKGSYMMAARALET